MLDLKMMLTKIAKSLATTRALTLSPTSNRSVTDANSAPDGIVYCSSGVSNVPENYVVLMTMTVAGYKQQVAFQMSGIPSKIYSRKRGNTSSSAWTAWKSASLS